MVDFSKYDKALDMDAVAEQMNKAAENSFDNLPEGEYDVKLDSLEVKESKSEKLMLVAAYRVISGKMKNRLMFQNIVISGTRNDGFMIHQARQLIDKLGFEAPEFSGYADFAAEIDEIAEAAVGEEYTVSLTYENEYPRYDIR